MTLLASLQVQREALIPYIATALINQLAEEEEPSLLLLDDYSCITQQVIHASLASLVECQLPHVHLILATRSDPPFLLARLRGHGQVLEIRAERLRCTPEETRLFLDAVIGIALYEPEVKEVTARTEGWLAGLQLLGLSLQGRGATETLLQELSGSQNYILDYLTDEVLGRQPVEIQTFLVHTSILERLSASLCDAVMECSGSQHILEHLERANLFTISLDAQRQWYRYHGLFAEAMRYRLEQWEGGQVPALHLRTSRWYGTHSFTGEAMEHALLGQDWEQAATLIEHIIVPMLWQRSGFPLVLHWLERLPPDVIRSRSRLCFVYAWVLHYVSSADAFWLEVAEAGLTQQQAASVAPSAEKQADLDDLHGELFTLPARMGVLEGDGQKIHLLCQQALAHLSLANRFARLEVLFLQSVADFLLGDLEPVAQKALVVATLAQEVGSVPQVLLHLAHVTRCLYRQGQFHEAMNTTRRADQVGRMPGGCFFARCLSPALRSASGCVVERRNAPLTCSKRKFIARANLPLPWRKPWSSLLAKLGVGNRTQAAMRARSLGLFSEQQ